VTASVPHPSSRRDIGHTAGSQLKAALSCHSADRVVASSCEIADYRVAAEPRAGTTPGNLCGVSLAVGAITECPACAEVRRVRRSHAAARVRRCYRVGRRAVIWRASSGNAPHVGGRGGGPQRRWGRVQHAPTCRSTFRSTATSPVFRSRLCRSIRWRSRAHPAESLGACIARRRPC
jgi:hypothetical protein